MINLFLLSLIGLFFVGNHAINNTKGSKTALVVPMPPVMVTDTNQLSSSVYPLNLIDGNNRNVTISKEPQHIISIAPSVTEVIFAVGAGDKLIAIDFNSNYPNETKDLPKISNYPSLDTETIIALGPDLIFGAGITSQDDIKLLENQGFTVFILAPFDVKDILADIEVVGLITDHEAEANILKSSLQECLDEIEQNVSTLAFKPKIYIEYFSEPLYTFGKGTYGHDLIELAGGINIAENATGLYPQINNEFVIIQNPDLIFYAEGPWTTTNLTTISKRTGWSSINAVKNGHIYPINEDWISRGGPRIIDALEEIFSKVKLATSPSNNNRITTAFEWYWILILIPIFVIMVERRHSSS